MLFKRFSSQQVTTVKKVTLDKLRSLYSKQIPLAMITATDYPSARIADYTDADIILVGDSLAMVALGQDTTIHLSLDYMTHHSKAVMRGVNRAFVTADMPYGTYQVSFKQALQNAFKLIQGSGVDAVKVEGGIRQGLPGTVRNMVRGGVAVMGHVGLTPQATTLQSGYKAQGTLAQSAYQIYQDALALQDAGAFSMVIECVPHEVAALITSALEIPTIGIGAGSKVSGQVLVQHDMLGIYGYNQEETQTIDLKQASSSKLSKMPKFCKQYASVGQIMHEAIQQYVDDVKTKKFPVDGQHTFKISEAELDKFRELIKS